MSGPIRTKHVLPDEHLAPLEHTVEWKLARSNNGYPTLYARNPGERWAGIMELGGDGILKRYLSERHVNGLTYDDDQTEKVKVT